MTRSQSEVGTEPNGPQESVPAAVTTASGAAQCSARSRTASSVAALSETSTIRKSATSAAGACLSSTIARSPSLRRAATTAAPRPLAPPETSTFISAHLAQCLGEPGCRPPLVIRHDHDVAAPAAHQPGLGEGVGGVVAALDPDVGAQLPEHPLRAVLVEHHDLVDAAERAQHLGAVGLAVDGPARPLEPGDRIVGDQAHDQAVAQVPCRP